MFTIYEDADIDMEWMRHFRFLSESDILATKPVHAPNSILSSDYRDVRPDLIRIPFFWKLCEWFEIAP